MNEHIVFTYHRIDNNVFETCLKSLRKVAPNCHIVIFSDDMPEKICKIWDKRYNIDWKIIPSSNMEKQRAAFKVKSLNDFALTLPDGDRVIAADADLYFMKNPFNAFNKFAFDLGLTTRAYHYSTPINAGVYFYRICKNLRKLLEHNTEQVYDCTWGKYYEYRQKAGHLKFGRDWSVGQDYLNVVWQNKENILISFGVKVVDVGPNYNYHPSEQMDNSTRKQMISVYNNKLVSVLHLKTNFKQLIYDKIFAGSITRYKKGPMTWQ